MRYRTLPWLVLSASLALGACQAPSVPVGARKTAVSAKPEAHSPTPSASGTAASGAPASPPPASPRAPERLLRPSGDVSVLKGVFALDAGYLLAVGGGSLLSDKGAGVLGIGIGAGTAISNNGAGLVTAADGTLLASGTGNLISNNGSALTGKVKLRVLEEGEAALPGLGTELPAAGMPLRAYALVDGTPLAVGEDAKGQPVYEVYTNAKGEFELYLPADAPGHNIRLAAAPTGVADERLSYELVEPLKTEEAVQMAETSRLLARYTRQTLGARLPILVWGEEAGYTGDDLELTPELTKHAATVSKDLHDAAVSSGLPTAPADVQARGGQRAADAVLAFVDFDAVMMLDGKSRAMGELARVFGEMQAATATRLAADPTFFDKQGYIIAESARLPAGQKYAITKPSDIGDFLLATAMKRPPLDRDALLETVLSSIGVEKPSRVALTDAISQLSNRFLFELIFNDDASAAAIASLKAKP